VRVHVGFISPSSGWEVVCAQEGVPYGLVDVHSADLSQVCSILVVNRALMSSERESIEHFLARGGAVIGYAQHLSPITAVHTDKQQLEYIVSQEDPLLSDIHILDLGMKGIVAKEANLLRSQANTYSLFAGSLGKGYGVALPFDLEDIVGDRRVASKNFYANSERLPSERVSLVGKGEVRHLLHRAFEYLHHVRGLPYAHVWQFPHGNPTLFAFRVDTDRAERSDVDSLHALARERGLALSWYLDVGSHENWLMHFQTMVGQEFGVHCYEHEVYPTEDGNLKNIARALRSMQEAGFSPAGFAAPYGIWTPELAHAVEQLAFQYSSEFAYIYDSFPVYPEIPGKRFTTLQVPIHPICTGSMQKVGFGDAQMVAYFKGVIERKIRRNEPLFLYDHPVHRRWKVAEAVFDEIDGRGIGNITLQEYAHWWKVRQSIKLTLAIQDDLLTVTGIPDPEDLDSASVWLRVVKADGSYLLVPLEPRIDVGPGAAWNPGVEPVPPPGDIRRIRDFDLRGMLGNLYTSMSRKLR
jgi:hypothetical protein